jgi:galactonate dehydratase
MKIQHIKTNVVRLPQEEPLVNAPVAGSMMREYVTLQIVTDEGIEGIGVTGFGGRLMRSLKTAVEDFGALIIGEDPLRSEAVMAKLRTASAPCGPGGMATLALSAFDIALWDIRGKALGTSVACLLGGLRERVPAYASGALMRTSALKDVERAASALVDKGYRQMKTQMAVDGLSPAQEIERIRAVRNAVGPDVDVLIDVHRRLAPMHAIELADALAEFSPYWLEEPCQAENVEALADVRRASRIPVVTGEALLTRAAFRPIFRARAVDIINPDVANCGGILELMYIAAVAESEAIAVSPHNYNSTTLALSATVHASACMPNFIITEYFLPFEELGQRLCSNVLRPVDGYIALPEGPGLGLNVDEGAVRAHMGKPFPARTFHTIDEEGP